MDTETEKTTGEQIAEILDELGFTIESVRIPHRSDIEQDYLGKTAIHWSVVVRNANGEISTNYSQGAPHRVWRGITSLLPDNDWKPFFSERPRNGKPVPMIWKRVQFADDFIERHSVIQPPQLVDVMYCLVSDCAGIEDRTFFEWCDDYGMDNDSIRARDSYHTVQNQSVILRRMVGDSWDQLRELCNEY